MFACRHLGHEKLMGPGGDLQRELARRSRSVRPATAGGMEQKPIARQPRHLLERARLFVRREEVKKQRRQPGVVQRARDKSIAWTQAAAAAAVNEEDQRAGSIDNRQIAIKRRASSGNAHLVHDYTVNG